MPLGVQIRDDAIMNSSQRNETACDQHIKPRSTTRMPHVAATCAQDMSCADATLRRKPSDDSTGNDSMAISTTASARHAEACRKSDQMTDLSLVVCTRNRARSLANCLDHMLDLRSRFKIEALVIDNGSSDNTRDVALAKAKTATFPMRYIFEDRPGVGRAMNTGYVSSQGSIVAFTDDDCYVDSNLCDAIMQGFEDPAIGYMGGRIELFDPTDARITIDERTEIIAYPPNRPIFAGMFHGANLAFRRAALDMINGIDPWFGPGSLVGSGADIDAVARVSRAGWAGLYQPTAVVRHHHGRKLDHLPSLRRQYAIGRGAFNAKSFHESFDIIGLARALRISFLVGREDPRAYYYELVGVARYLKVLQQKRRLARMS
ncbi:glycosyltransferase [Bradyrhizobium sp. LHD-71]|uniref:glycosyltransferase n=1 Tax=Bradyrhizobium sp. LHD-71 TaxID=3072141 RepID=UPI00280D553B|nr:glycosyltransferase [Bradyrhizobium sp. LHD-71]MDQ8727646.1 glycosyltransferase [Bradyrhizobium sp. LHD-71]